MKNFLVILFLLVASTSTFAQVDTLDFAHRHYRSASNVSPSVVDFIEVAAVASSTNHGLFLQQGDGKHLVGFNAIAARTSGKFDLQGGASYCAYERFDVRFNETADLEIVYPYVMADTVGGDLKGENYNFWGSCAGSRNNFKWGVRGAYEARIESRNIDPRPKNVSSNFMLEAGFGYSFAHVGIGTNIYRQTNDIDFYSELGNANIYHLSGLLQHYTRFAGTNSTAYYDGNRYFINAEVGALSDNLLVSLTYARFTLEKQLADLNNVPIASFAENTFDAAATYINPFVNTTVYCKTQTRTGTENIYGDATSNVYIKIAEEDQFRLRTHDIGLELTRQIASFKLAINAAHLWRCEEYSLPYQTLENKQIALGATLEYIKRLGNIDILVGANFNHINTRDCELIITNSYYNTLLPLLTNQHAAMQTDQTQFAAKLDLAYKRIGIRGKFNSNTNDVKNIQTINLALYLKF